MSAEVEEYQEIVEKYLSLPEENLVAPDRQLDDVEYSRSLTKIQKEDTIAFNGSILKFNQSTLESVSENVKDVIQSKLYGITNEMERLKSVYLDNKQKMRNSKLFLRKTIRGIQQENLERSEQLRKFVEFKQDKYLKFKAFRAWNVFRNTKIFRKTNNNKVVNFCERYRNRKVADRTFASWKYMVTQWGIQLKLKKKYEEDLNAYKEEYLNVIALLQENIKNVENQIAKKRQARKEFSFNLSRNLLKTISNLSMEVVSLNQFAIKDKEIGNELEAINSQVKQKLKNLESIQIKVTLEEEDDKKDKNSGIFSQNVTKSSLIQ